MGIIKAIQNWLNKLDAHVDAIELKNKQLRAELNKKYGA